jgi:integrase
VPEDATAILHWLSRNTKPVSALADPAVTRAVLDAAATLVDGRPASAWTARGNHAVLGNALEYAVELGLLTRNPVKAIKWKAPKTTNEVDRRSVVSHAQARRLLEAVREQAPSGPRLVAFFAVLYYAALRPEEAVNLREDNLTIPPLVWNETTTEWEEPADDWGSLRFSSAAPEVGAEWTNNGARREQRRLKARAEGEWRHVPTAPH